MVSHIMTDQQNEESRAVYLMEDFTGGQFDLFEDSPEYGRRMYRYAQIALAQQTYPLSKWGRSVAERLVNEIPVLLKRIEEQVQDETEPLPAIKLDPKSIDRSGYVYVLQSPTGYYKIGRTRNPQNRIQTFGVLLPFEVAYLYVIATTNMVLLETRLHQRFAEKRAGGEWFALDENDIAYIAALAEGQK
jgi:hypothetical protein